METGPQNESQHDQNKLLALLSPSSTSAQHIEGLLTLGLSSEDLFSVLDVKVSDMGLISNDDNEAFKEMLGDDAEADLLSMGVPEYELADGADNYLDDRMVSHNSDAIEKFGDPDFLIQRGQRMLEDLRNTTHFLLGNESPVSIVEWWTTPSDFIYTGDRPIDRIKTNPWEVHAAAYAWVIDRSDNLETLTL